MTPVTVAAVALLSFTAMTAAASENHTAVQVQPCNLDSEASIRILDQLALLVQVYLGRALEQNEIVQFLPETSNERENCEKEYVFNVSMNIHDVMIKSWAISLQGASPPEYVPVEDIERLLNKLEGEIQTLSFTHKLWPVFAVKPEMLNKSFENGLRRIEAVADAGHQMAKIREAMAQNHQVVQANLTTILEKLEAGNQCKCNSSAFKVSNPNQTETGSKQDSTKPTVPVPVSLPALDSSARSHIQASYPPCANASNLIEANRLQKTLSLASSSRFRHLSQAAIYSAILDAILTPSPLICTQDYVRLAYKVLKNEESSSSGTKKEMAVLKSRFRDEVFDLFESNEWHIMSVSKPRFGLFATKEEIPGVPQYACSVMKPTSSEGNPAFNFKLIPQDGGRHFLVESVLTGTNFQLYHLCRTSECPEDQSDLIISPTEAFVLGTSDDGSSPLQFRFIRRYYGESCRVGTAPFWGLPIEMTKDAFLISSASVSEVASPETLFYLA